MEVWGRFIKVTTSKRVHVVDIAVIHAPASVLVKCVLIVITGWLVGR
jgi:hypothetical protein